MGFHTYPIERAEALRDPERYRYCSREELLAAISPDPAATVADLGSGTGFYTDDVAPAVGTVYAVDVQEAMHDLYRDHGVPETVDLVTAEVGDLPFDDGELDRAFSTMTYHEFAGDGALDELSRVLRDGGVLVTVDWTSEGSGEEGPPTEQRYSLTDAMGHHRDAGFEVVEAEDRPETFKLVARKRR
ncbi:SAM-dependent methyltransferase [Halobacteriales archaeon QS_8_69_26]|nr:MAG: SAM-dependent methyltransferase [Halobacteriales archaeon QS_8_69_26]